MTSPEIARSNVDLCWEISARSFLALDCCFRGQASSTSVILRRLGAAGPEGASPPEGRSASRLARQRRHASIGPAQSRGMFGGALQSPAADCSDPVRMSTTALSDETSQKIMRMSLGASCKLSMQYFVAQMMRSASPTKARMLAPTEMGSITSNLSGGLFAEMAAEEVASRLPGPHYPAALNLHPIAGQSWSVT